LAIWKRIENDKNIADISKYQKIHFLNIISMLDRPAELLAQQILESPRDPLSTTAAIRVLWAIRGPTEELLAWCTSTGTADRATAERLLPYRLLLLGALKRHGEIAEILRASPAMRRLSPQLASVAHAIATRDDTGADEDEKLLAEEVHNILESVRQQGDRLWRYLADTARSIAVVGNSGCELGLGKGPEIDAHDLVIRFNSFSLAGKFAADYGTKTSIVSMPPTLAEEYLKNIDPSKPVVVAGARYLELVQSMAPILHLAFKGIVPALYPHAGLETLIGFLEARPSSGMQMIDLLVRIRGGTNNLDFYGFSFTDQIGRRARSSHYYEDSKPAARHNWVKERMLFDRLKQAGPQASTAEHAEAPPKQEHKAMKIKFVGDRSDYHCGGAAVTSYIMKELQAKGSVVDGDDYDVLVINGEGSIHHRTPAYQKKIREARNAYNAGKDYYIINTVWQNNGKDDSLIVKRAKEIITRECMSKLDLFSDTGAESTIIPDFSYAADVDDTTPFKDYAGITVSTDFYSAEFGTFVQASSGFLSKYPLLNLRQTTWSFLVRSLATAGLLVTGRHHAVYAACRARTPFVAVAGDCHKIEGLVATAGIPIPVCRSPRELGDAIAWARNNRAAYDDLFDWLDAQPKWSFTI